MDTRRILYHARINRRLTLTQLGVRTALSPSVLRNIDEGRFELLPSGLYARSYIRTFAGAVGLDPEATVRAVEHLLPGAPDPLCAMNAAKGVSLSERLAKHCATLLAGLRANVPGFHGPEVPGSQDSGRPGRIDQPAVPIRAEPRQSAVLDRVAPWPRTMFTRVAPWPRAVLTRVAPWRVEPWQGSLRPQLTRCGAAAIDAALLLAVDAFLVLLISWSSGVNVDLLLHGAGWALGSFCAVPIVLYFVLFDGIGGSTLGRYVCSHVDPVPDHPLTLPDILRRAVLR